MSSRADQAVYLLTLSYRGTAYAGWQRQANAPTVQQMVEEAISELVCERVTVVAASRTDAGVHARGQAAHLRLTAAFPERGLVHGSNFRLPEDVRVLSAERRPAEFHARRSARSKIYSYHLVRSRVISPLDEPFATRVNLEIETGPMVEAAAALAGEHDFGAFTLTGGSHTHTRRKIFAAGWRERGDHLWFWIEGEGFLRGMVRTLVGTLIDVGMGRRTPASFAELLDGRPRDQAGPTAPAQGLVLERVRYEPDEAGEGPVPLW